MGALPSILDVGDPLRGDLKPGFCLRQAGGGYHLADPFLPSPLAEGEPDQEEKKE